MAFEYIIPFDFPTDTGGALITGSILATGVQRYEHIRGFDLVAKNRMEGVDFTPILVYMIDTVPAHILPYLAAQFDVMGVKGWKFAKTEAERRDLIKNAINLHRYKGTPWAIEEAARRIGFPNAQIIEGIGMFYDGSVNYDGSVTYSGSNWACFRVVFDLGNFNGISAEQTADLQAIVNEYKNKRSHLTDISFRADLVDVVEMVDELVVKIIVRDVEDTFGATYNGSFSYNGATNYSTYGEEVLLT